MKKLLLSVVFIIGIFHSQAQTGNEWISFDIDQRYVKFQIAENGLYRIDKSPLEFALQSLSPSVHISNIDPRSIHVFAKGEEQTLFIQGQGDGSFDNGDYIELYCKTNDVGNGLAISKVAAFVCWAEYAPTEYKRPLLSTVVAFEAEIPLAPVSHVKFWAWVLIELKSTMHKMASLAS